MQIRFLEITDDACFLLGYPLNLTNTQRKILLEIAQMTTVTADDLLPCLSSKASRGNVSVHISEINKKAFAISGRKLIIFESKNYKLNPYM